MENLISVKEAADIIGATTKAVYGWLDSGRLTRHTIGRHFFLDRGEVEEFAKQWNAEKQRKGGNR